MLLFFYVNTVTVLFTYETIMRAGARLWASTRSSAFTIGVERYLFVFVPFVPRPRGTFSIRCCESIELSVFEIKSPLNIIFIWKNVLSTVKDHRKRGVCSFLTFSSHYGDKVARLGKATSADPFQTTYFAQWIIAPLHVSCLSQTHHLFKVFFALNFATGGERPYSGGTRSGGGARARALP